MAISLAALGVNLDRLAQAQVGPTPSTLYTAPSTGGATRRSQVSSVVVSNVAPLTSTVRLELLPSGATSDGSQYLLGDQVIPPNSSLTFEPGIFLRPGDRLVASSDALAAPTSLKSTGSTTGGTLTAGTWYYKLTGVNAGGETLPSIETQVTTTGSTSSVTLTWRRSLGVTGYKMYRGTTTGGEILLATITDRTLTSYVDTGAATTSGAPPTVATANGCTFTISGAELPA